jgi:exoribonuclease R
MAKGDHRARVVERGIVDLVEAVLLQDRVGETFVAIVIDDALVQLRDPAVRGRLTGESPEPGSEVTVRLDRADPATRTVEFSVAPR